MRFLWHCRDFDMLVERSATIVVIFVVNGPQIVTRLGNISIRVHSCVERSCALNHTERNA
ncbi:hypothetical protein B7435_08030 [Mycolicibacterium peregrinum]|nr:hypothetical protein AWC21_09705 [Mycolicibacterium peregrinum]OWM05632.1 hypothetical protein B7435_08030 [Mycolicibacterium peregrinum]